MIDIYVKDKYQINSRNGIIGDSLMKIVWITNIPIGDVAKELNTNSGLWMDALLDELKDKADISLVVVTSWNVTSVKKKKINGITYYLMPGGAAGSYKRNMEQAQKEWDNLFDEEKPDMLQVWGSENSHVIPALYIAKKRNIPRVIYIQGLLKSIARHADGHVSYGTMLRYITLRDIYRKQLWVRQKEWFKKRSRVEELILKLADGVIVENLWAEAFCKYINPNLAIYKIPLNISKAFSQVSWTYENMTPHTIVCNASGYAYKGLHVLIEALRIVKNRYPDVRLNIPGRNMKVGKGVLRQKAPGYWVYINDLIKKYNLEDNIRFTGHLNQNELADMLSKSNVFVLCSAIENHSSSLKEAMSVGTPAIAAMVGGVSEYFESMKCGFLYRYEEVECLAGYIMDLFESEERCKSFSEYSKDIVNRVDGKMITTLVLKMYEHLKEQN